MPTARTTSDRVDAKALLHVLTQYQRGDFNARMLVDRTGIAGKVYDTLNHIIEQNQTLTAEIKRISTDLMQPTTEDHRAMGPNLMSTRNRNPVIQTAIRTVREQLRAPGIRELLRDLPPGPDYKIREPDGPPDTWPDTLPGVRRRDDDVEAEAV